MISFSFNFHTAGVQILALTLMTVMKLIRINVTLLPRKHYIVQQVVFCIEIALFQRPSGNKSQNVLVINLVSLTTDYRPLVVQMLCTVTIVVVLSCGMEEGSLRLGFCVLKY